MNAAHLSSAEFWEDGGSFVAGELAGPLPELGSCVVFQTSGSTGEGKWIVLKKGALLHSAKAVNEWLEVIEESVWGLALPLNHVGGFSILARVYAAGCGLEVFEGKWDSKAFVEWLAEAAVTHVSLVPTQVHDLVLGGFCCPEGVGAVVVGGGNLSEKLGQAARDLGWPVLASYGMTETCSQVATQSTASLDLPFADEPLEILPIWVASTSEEGRLSLEGEALFSGQLVRAEEGWSFDGRAGSVFKTNDRVKLEGRRLKVLGRVDSLVKIMGELVDLEEVERAFIESSGGVLPRDSFAVVNGRNERRENELVAVFEGDLGREPDFFEAYQEQASGILKLAKWCKVSSFPRSELGKLRRGELREMVGELFSGGVSG